MTDEQHGTAVDRALMIVIVRAKRDVDDDLWGDGLKSLYDAIEAERRAATAAERERCAKACEAVTFYDYTDPAATFAAAIRALKD